MEIVQFAGRLYHRNCFDDYLNQQKSQNRVTSNYEPNIKLVEESEIDVEDVCEECSGSLIEKDSAVETPSKKDDDDDSVKKDDSVTNTPSQPLRRRGR